MRIITTHHNPGIRLNIKFLFNFFAKNRCCLSNFFVSLHRVLV